MLQFESKFKTNRKYTTKYKKPIKHERQICNWSDYQKVIFNDVATGEGNSVIISGPGSAKTTTICESIWHLPEEFRMGERTLFTAFNNSIAKVLQTKVPFGVAVKTHHSLGFDTVRRNWGSTYNIGSFGSVDKDNDSLFEMADIQVGNKADKFRLRQMLVLTIDLCKSVLADSEEEIIDVTDKFGIDYCGISAQEFAGNVHEMLDKCKQAPRILNGRNVISFSDMVWLPIVSGWSNKKFDNVFGDESQDFTPVRTELLSDSVAANGRIFIVGDPKQSIYSWAGVNENVMDILTNRFSAKQLNLTVSYRCPKSIIELAQRINPLIEAAPNAIDGAIDTIQSKDLYDEVKDGSVILSRTNWPLVRACFKFLSQGRKVNIHGRDISERFNWRIRCWSPDTVEALVTSINTWREEMVDRLISRKQNTDYVEDEAKSLELFTEGADTVEEVKDRINNFFSDDETQIKLSSVHRYKGLEKENVYLLNKSFNENRGGEEERIYYTAITRSSNNLTFVEGKI